MLTFVKPDQKEHGSEYYRALVNPSILVNPSPTIFVILLLYLIYYIQNKYIAKW